MNCGLCDTNKDLVRLNCGQGLHLLCVSCNNQLYNTPLRDGENHDVPGTHTTRCPFCRAQSVALVDRSLVPRPVLLNLRQTIGVTVDRYVRPLYHGLPPPVNN
ncbi:MAG: hypothetical protein HY774_06815 [Acidobacteria bacterium]|nr:hypothetical protein [Acidobacteriota bacterium]